MTQIINDTDFFCSVLTRLLNLKYKFYAIMYCQITLSVLKIKINPYAFRLFAPLLPIIKMKQSRNKSISSTWPSILVKNWYWREFGLKPKSQYSSFLEYRKYNKLDARLQMYTPATDSTWYVGAYKPHGKIESTWYEGTYKPRGKIEQDMQFVRNIITEWELRKYQEVNLVELYNRLVQYFAYQLVDDVFEQFEIKLP